MENKLLNSIKLSDVIDLNFLQEFQDNFAIATGIAAITVDDKGPVTKPSNFTDFCLGYARMNDFSQCNNCDLSWGNIAAEKGEPVVYDCYMGLTDFAVPILLEGKHIGSILGGQIFTKQINENYYRAIAKKTGINEEAYINAIRKIKIVNYEQVKAAANLLFMVANSVSKIAHKNYELIKKSQKEEVYRNIVESIRSSIDINTIKKNIVNYVGNAMGAYRCFIVTMDKDKDKFCTLDEASIYLSSPDVESLVGINPEQKEISFISNSLKDLKDIIYVNTDDFIQENNIAGKDLDNFFKHYNIKTAFCLPIIYYGKFYGVLVLHHNKVVDNFSKEARDFITSITNQIGVALHQNNIYEQEKKAAQRENLLRNITEKITSTLDIDKVLSFICNEVAKLFNVQRAIIVEYPNKQDYGDYIVRREFKANNSIKSIRDLKHHKRSAAYWGEAILTSDNILAFDNIEESDAPDKFKKSYKKIGVKSALGCAIQKDNNKWGMIILCEYNNYRCWSREEKKLLSTISNQIYISIQQAELYSKTINQAEIEKAILNNLPFMAWLKDEKSNFLAVNSEFAKHYKFDVNNIIGKNDGELFSGDIAKKHLMQDAVVIKNNQQINIEEEIQESGKVKHYQIYKAPVLDEKGTVVGTTGFSMDITERKEMERMKNEFISIISHELRTPLTSIRGALGLVSSGTLGELPGKVNSLLKIADNNVIRLVNLINDILDLEKIQAGKMDFNFAEYDVMELLDYAIQFNEEYAKQYSISFNVKDRLNGALVNVDKDKFIQVLTNLLSNAVKFSLPNETVDISVERKNKQIFVSVINKGHGIPPEFHSKIFESFSQVDSSDSRKKGGTGLGLSICKSITEKMSGNIGFSSVVDDKTIFYVEFPEISKNNQKKRVLICDDNKTSSFCIQKMFDELNYQADIALCAKEASDFLASNSYDLMTLDLFLPDKNGFTLLNEIRENKKTKDLPVIIISVAPKNIELVDNKSGVIDWIEKSFDTEDLKAVIDKVMAKKNKNKVEILHIENDKDLLSLVDLTLSDIANVNKASSLEEAKSVLKKKKFDIIIMDYVFPEGKSDILLPTIKSGINKDAKLVLFSAYQADEILTEYVDIIILKTNVSNEQFKQCIEKFIEGLALKP